MSVLRNIVYFLVASVLAKPLGFLLSFALAKALGPEHFGVWITLMLINAYSPIACLGSVETLLKQVPYYLGRNDTQKIREIENGVMGSIILSAAAVLVVTCFVPLVLPMMSLGADSLSVIMLLVCCAVNYFSAYFYQRFAAYQNFKAAGTIDLSRSILALLFVGSGAWLWGLHGATAGYLLHEIFVCALSAVYNTRMHGKVGFSFKSGLLAHVVRVGFPITLLWWITNLSNTVDRVVLGSLLGPISVGHYALGISLSTVLALLPMVVGRVLYPQINKQVGTNAGGGSVRTAVLAPTFTLSSLVVNLQLAVLVAMPLLYNQLLPKYQPGLLAGQILIMGSFFSCLVRNGANYLIAVNQERVFLKYILITLAANAAVDVSLVKLGLGISGVALGTSFAGFLSSTLVWRKVLLDLRLSRQEIWHTLFSLYLPFIVCIGIVFLVRAMYIPAFNTFDGFSILRAVIIFALLNAILYAIPVYRAEMQGWKRNAFRAKRSFSRPLTPAEVSSR